MVLSRTEGSQTPDTSAVTSAADVSSVLEGAGLVADPVGGAGLLAVLGVAVDVGGARLVAALARRGGGELVTVLCECECECEGGGLDDISA